MTDDQITQRLDEIFQRFNQEVALLFAESRNTEMAAQTDPMLRDGKTVEQWLELIDSHLEIMTNQKQKQFVSGLRKFLAANRSFSNLQWISLATTLGLETPTPSTPQK